AEPSARVASTAPSSAAAGPSRLVTLRPAAELTPAPSSPCAEILYTVMPCAPPTSSRLPSRSRLRAPFDGRPGPAARSSPRNSTAALVSTYTPVSPSAASRIGVGSLAGPAAVSRPAPSMLTNPDLDQASSPPAQLKAPRSWLTYHRPVACGRCGF